MKTLKISLVALLFVFCGKIYSQGGSIGASDARSMGMAKTYTASSFGLYSLGINPANLYRDSTKKVELIIPLPLPNITANIGTNFMTIDEYNYFFGYSTTDSTGKKIGRYLNTADKQRLKDLFADGGTFTSDLEVRLFAVSVKPNDKFGTIAFSISDVISSNVTFPKGIIDLGIDGNLPNKVFNFNDTALKSWWLRKYSLSYARSLDIFPFFKSFSFGVSFNIVSGYAYAGLDHVNTQLTTGDGNVITGKGDFLAYSAFSPDFHVKYDFDSTSTKQDASVSMFPTPAGGGFGFDFGFNARISESTSIGFAVTDIGSITWDKNAAQYSSNKAIYLDDLSNKDQLDSLKNALTGKGGGKYISSFSTPLATALRLGIAIQLDKMLDGNFPGKMLLAFDYNQGFNDQPRNSMKPRFSFGADWQLGLFALRTGFSFGGFDKFNWGMGIGFDFKILELNFGTPDMQYVFASNSAKRITFAFDSRWKF